eukprot:TRINITY_DN4610_c1_g1_i1.p1 TRINITY_DN4610_c1_g1~~TRINITY_DN4610_c1_g1_i1.p1  ORF type:complete len:118 (+),score=10.09 TRINITY_DN4610_c1_g1_i1:2192-2545(+)
MSFEDELFTEPIHILFSCSKISSSKRVEAKVSSSWLVTGEEKPCKPLFCIVNVTKALYLFPLVSESFPHKFSMCFLYYLPSLLFFHSISCGCLDWIVHPLCIRPYFLFHFIFIISSS